jgi:hypothetical protein
MTGTVRSAIARCGWLLLTGVVSCSFLIDTGSLTGKGDSTGNVDGSLGAGDALSAPGNGDSGSIDGGTAGDGDAALVTPGADSGSNGGVDASPPFSCAAGDLCLDFDGNETFIGNLSMSGAGVATVDATRPFRGTRSAHFRKTATSAGTARFAIETKGALFVRCDFMVWLEHTGGGELEVLAHYRFPVTGSSRGYEIFGLTHGNGGGGGYSHLIETIDDPFRFDRTDAHLFDSARSRWVRVETSMGAAGSRVDIDGQFASKPLAYPQSGQNTTNLIFGVNSADIATDTWDVFIDEIRCRR